jgi:hypothetical protein
MGGASMSITTSRGRRIVTEERRRLKKKDEVEGRSRLAFELLCEGRSREDVAALLRITVRHLYRLVAAMPTPVKRQIKRKVAAERRALLDDMAERLEAS